MKLNDQNIRKSWIAHLEKSFPKPRKILNELHVVGGMAIADIVSLHSECHCYEIKGATDSISRLKRQGKYFDESFRRNTLITTENHITNAAKYIPSYWGIVLAKVKNGKIVFRYVRKAKRSERFTRASALKLLWRDELIELAEQSGTMINSKMNKKDLSELIGQNYQTKKLSEDIATILLFRNRMSSP